MSGINKVSPSLTNSFKVKEKKDIVSTTAKVDNNDQHDQELLEQIKKALSENNLDQSTAERLKQLLGQLDEAGLKQLLDQLNPDQLNALLSNLDEAGLKQLLDKLSPDELKALISNLDDAGLKQLLAKMNPAELKEILSKSDDPELKQLLAKLDKLNPDELKAIVKQLDTAKLKQLLAKLSPEKLKAILISDKAQIKTALGQLKYKELRAKLGHLPPGPLRDAFNKLVNKMDDTTLLDLLTNSEQLLDQHTELANLDSEHLQGLMNNIKDSCPPEQQEIMEQLMSCSTEDELTEFAKNNVFMNTADTFNVGAGVATTSNRGAVGDGYHPLTSQMDHLYDGLLSDTAADKNVLKTVMLLLLQYSLVQRDSLGLMAKQISGIKAQTKDLNEWWDAIQSVNQDKHNWASIKTGDKTKPPESKDIYFSNPPSMQEILKYYDKMDTSTKEGAEAKAALTKLANKIKEDLPQENFPVDWSEGSADNLIKKINAYWEGLQKNLNCATIAKIKSDDIFDPNDKTKKIGSTTNWGAMAGDFQKSSGEAGTIQQEATTMLQSKSTDLQTSQNLLTKWLETTQAIMQKASS